MNKAYAMAEVENLISKIDCQVLMTTREKAAVIFESLETVFTLYLQDFPIEERPVSHVDNKEIARLKEIITELLRDKYGL